MADNYYKNADALIALLKVAPDAEGEINDFFLDAFDEVKGKSGEAAFRLKFDKFFKYGIQHAGEILLTPAAVSKFSASYVAWKTNFFNRTLRFPTLEEVKGFLAPLRILVVGREWNFGEWVGYVDHLYNSIAELKNFFVSIGDNYEAEAIAENEYIAAFAKRYRELPDNPVTSGGLANSALNPFKEAVKDIMDSLKGILPVLGIGLGIIAFTMMRRNK